MKVKRKKKMRLLQRGPVSGSLLLDPLYVILRHLILVFSSVVFTPIWDEYLYCELFQVIMQLITGHLIPKYLSDALPFFLLSYLYFFLWLGIPYISHKPFVVIVF